MEITEKINPTSIEEQCKDYGILLGLENPVSEQVLKTALENEEYARNLLMAKQMPSFLRLLLDNPPDSKKTKTIITDNVPDRQLLKNGAKAILKWAKTGFSIVAIDVIERRENACLGCPNYSEPETTLQKIIPSNKITKEVGRRTGNNTCNLCGCSISKKIRLTSESCPDKHPTKSGYTRWNEVIK